MRHALHYPDKAVGKWALAGSIAIIGAMAFASIAKGEEPTVTTTVAQTQSLSEYSKKGSFFQASPLPSGNEQTARAIAAGKAAQALSIEQSQVWYKYNKGAAAEAEVELARLKEIMSAGGQTNVTQTRSLPE